MINKSLILNTKLPGMNQFIEAAKIHPKANAAMKKKYTTLVTRELIRQKCVPDKPYKAIRVNYVFCESGDPRDPDNILTGCKFIHDAFVITGIIEEDDIYQISFGSIECMPGCKNNKVIVNWDVIE